MTTYLDIIPLDLAKKFLRVDGNHEDDIITLYIESSCKIFEQKTEVALAQKEKPFYEGKRYYVDPISDEEDVLRKSLYFIPKKDLTLVVGYADPLDVPSDVKQCILKMVQGMYLAEEKNEFYSFNSEVEVVINLYKRFWI